MKLTEALKTLHNRGFMVETRTSTRFARQTFKPEPEEVELPIIKASKQLKDYAEANGYELDEEVYDLDELQQDSFKEEVKDAVKSGFYIKIVSYRKDISDFSDDGQGYVELELRIDDGETPVIQVLRGDDYAYSTKKQFPLDEIQDAFKLAEEISE